MIHIEKLAVSSNTSKTWQTFVDIFTCSELERSQRQFARAANGHAKDFMCMDLIGKDVIANLSGVTLGKYFGTTGIDINMLLLGNIDIENLVLEISIDILNSLPSSKLKKLLENYIVIFNDFDEGGNFYGKDSLKTILATQNIKPKLLFFTGGCIHQEGFPELNVHKVLFDFWLFATAFSDEFFYSAIFDQTRKQTMLDQLETAPERFCVFPSMKPRQRRVMLLVMLDQLGLLDKCDWSLGLNLGSINHKQYEDFDLNAYFNQNQLGTEVLDFLNKYKFPRLLEGNYETLKDIVSPDHILFNKYKYYISSETYSGVNSFVMITEKTYKSFLIGSIPLLHTDIRARNYLNTLGFECHYASREPGDICQSLELLLAKPYHIAHRLHNFDLITNKDFLIKSAVQPLNKIASLINSIRR